MPQCKLLTAFCKKHRFALLAYAVGAAVLCLFWALRGSTAVMDWWLGAVSMPVKRGVSALVDPLPFSACEAGATLLILLALCTLLRCIWRVAHRRPGGFGTWLLHLGALLLCGYALVCLLWGTQYYGTGFAAKAGMQGGAVSIEDLTAVTLYFAERADASADTVPRDAQGTFAVATAELLNDSGGVYDALLGQYPFLAGSERRVKPAFYSKIMSAAGFTGYLCPLVGESTVNIDCPAVFLPATIAHELAHQRGVAAEQEANFVGVQAAVTSGKAAYVYSGWLFGYLHLSNALYSVSPETANAITTGLCPQARADLAANNAYWAQWEGPARTAGEQIYTTFLQGYDQTLGMKSYGACVDLLVEYYAPLASG